MTSAGNKKTIGSRLAGFGRGIGAASLGLTLSLGLIGCATGTPPGEEVATAHLLALDTYEAQLGAPIGVFGTGFPTADQGKAYLVFDGVWNADDGSQAQVYEEFLLKRVDDGSARWDSFGPYKIPFGSGDRTGTFTGKVSTEIHSRDGSIIARDPEPKDMTFKVLPSIIVHELQPITAHCPTQIERGIGGLPYRMRVEAVGFEPETFTYSIETPALDRAGRSVRRLATGRFDTFGDDGTFVLPQVPDDDSFYAAIFVVQATDAQGRTYTNNFALGVRRPLEVYYNGGVEVVEYFAPDPQTACIPGGPTGRDYQWNNTKVETATRGYNLVWQENWNTSHTVTQGQSRTVGASVVNGIGFGTTDSANFSWGTNSEVNGEIGIDMLVKAGIGGRRGYLRNNGGESGTSTSQTRSEGVDVSETTTETESVAQEEGGGMEQEFSNQVSSSASIGNTFGGQIVANTYGVVYTQKARLNRPALLIAYDQCGHSTVAADVNFTDWTWAIDLANGTQCDPLPASNLHKAQCFDDQCTENR